MSNVEDRYSRFRVLNGIGAQGLEKIRQASVGVVGIGGLGCVTASQFAALGVGNLRIVDRDIVELSNLQRQSLYTLKDIGVPKVEAARNRLQELNPDVEVDAIALAVTDITADRVVEGMDVIVDGLDHFNPRYAINRACVRHNIPYVFAGALGAIGNMSTIIPGKTPCLECTLGDVDPNQPTCATIGIFPTVLGVIGNLQVQETLRLILGQPPNLANKLLIFNIETYDFDSIPIARHKNCPTCGKEMRAPLPIVTSDTVITELCTENTYLLHAQSPPKIDLNKVLMIVKNQYPVIAKSHLAVQIQFTSDIQVSVVGEGNIMIKGVTSQAEALDIYQQILGIIQGAII